jgi:ABC-type lipoprotein release transport system permease subunit
VDAVKAILLSDKLNLVADPATTGVSILVLTGLTALAGLWPAARAAALPPVTAIQTVE